MTSAFLENTGIPFIDVLPDMEKALLKHGDIYPAWDDGHTILKKLVFIYALSLVFCLPYLIYTYQLTDKILSNILD